jgi:predicted TIM-barrel fold metal-dependent hydrolase
MIDTTDGQISVIDADAHVVEPADLWSARVSSRFKDEMPRVEFNAETGHNHWRVGAHWLWPAGYWGQAGYSEYPPLQPFEFDQIDPATYRAADRLERMSEYGVDSQVLYPNLIGFQAPLIAELGPELALLCTQAYNDFLLEWSSEDPSRLLPIAMLPYWDRDASVAEMERCIKLGHKGVLFANKFERVGLPSFCDPYWDPVYAVAQELDIPVNFHVGFALPELADLFTHDTLEAKRQDAVASRPIHTRMTAITLMSQCAVIGELLTSGICDRFPDLRFVSVESGFGQIPFYLESLDWHWKAFGNVDMELLPSEYFRRQCYGTLWFETTTLPLLKVYENNFMFSTDFPHPTSLSPGPASPSPVPSDHIRDSYAQLDPAVRRKVLQDNAKAVYKLA